MALVLRVLSAPRSPRPQHVGLLCSRHRPHVSQPGTPAATSSAPSCHETHLMLLPKAWLPPGCPWLGRPRPAGAGAMELMFPAAPVPARGLSQQGEGGNCAGVCRRDVGSEGQLGAKDGGSQGSEAQLAGCAGTNSGAGLWVLLERRKECPNPTSDLLLSRSLHGPGPLVHQSSEELKVRESVHNSGVGGRSGGRGFGAANCSS